MQIELFKIKVIKIQTSSISSSSSGSCWRFLLVSILDCAAEFQILFKYNSPVILSVFIPHFLLDKSISGICKCWQISYNSYN